MNHISMASDSWLFFGFGAALFYLKLNPAPLKSRDAYFFSWCIFFADLFLVLFFTCFKAWNSGDPHLYHVVEIWSEGVSWTVLAAGLLALYKALTPFTQKPERPAESDRRGRRDRSDADSREEEAEERPRDSGRHSETALSASDSRSSRRYLKDGGAEDTDPVLEKKVEDELSREPELVLSKDDELAMEPDFDEPLPKLPTPAPAIEPPKRPKTEVPVRPATDSTKAKSGIILRPRSEIVPAVRASGIRPSAQSGVRPSATSGIRPASPDKPATPDSSNTPAATRKPTGGKPSVEEPSRDQYLDK